MAEVTLQLSVVGIGPGKEALFVTFSAVPQNCIDGFERNNVPKVWDAFCAGELRFQKKYPELRKFRPKRPNALRQCDESWGGAKG